MKTDAPKTRNNEEPEAIIDGDARPDQNTDLSLADKKKKIKNKDNEKFSANRSGDVNSLENYKDEK